MTNDDQVAEIRHFYAKLQAKLEHEYTRAVKRLAQAEKSALRVFQKPAAPANGAPRVRKSRLDPDVQRAIIGAMSNEVAYTVKELRKITQASRSQVRVVIVAGLEDGSIVSDNKKRNSKYRLANQEVAHATE